MLPPPGPPLAPDRAAAAERLAQPFLSRCLAIDLEVGLHDGRIHRLAAVRSDTGEAFFHRGAGIEAALRRLDDFAAGCELLVGHNLIGFDAPHLAAMDPALRLLALPRVDTLRVNPLAFPRNPYHHLVKHYPDAPIRRGRRNDPELDARLALALLGDQHEALSQAHARSPALVAAWHGLAADEPGGAGAAPLLAAVRAAPAPRGAELAAALLATLEGRSCRTQTAAIAADPAREGWPLAYALAWISVAEGNSVMPPWVLHAFPAAGLLVRRLRDTPCGNKACAWCRERHDPERELARWFPQVDGFRPEPRGADGRPLQQAIVETAMRGDPALAILPTGTGKSLCYQLPALSRYAKTGALTVVISPLVALMADQVAGLEARGIRSAVAINGLLSMPERADALDRVRLGDASIVIIAPEQLRSRALRSALDQREIGHWVIDEAHCLSKWGHDFRPDYRYVARYIREKAARQPGSTGPPPILCLTATAKPEVVADIVAHFRERLGVEPAVYDGGASRSNLDFAVVATSPGHKLADIHELIAAELPPEADGGAIVYCASRRRTEEVAEFLRARGVAAAHFHAGLRPEAKKQAQQGFIAGALRVIVATNAFGMGIDKPDVRLVVHADVPGSLENYLQEAGRAGRDRRAARCVLLFVAEDVERQFGLSARSRLTRREIQAILKSLRSLDRRERLGGEVVATAGEILREERDAEFERDSATDDTRVRTALAWLEEATLLSREENVVQVFPSSLRVASRDEARARLARTPLPQAYRLQLLAIVDALLGAPADEGVSTDELMLASKLGPEAVRKALFDLADLGIASNDTALTAFVHSGVERSSLKRLQEAQALEAALIDELRTAAPELGIGDTSLLHLRHATQQLKDAGHASALPKTLWRLVRSLAADGRSEEGGTASLGLREIDSETVELRLQRKWSDIARTAELRRAAAGRLLAHLLGCLPAGVRGTDLQAATTLGRLLEAIKADLVLAAQLRQPQRLLDHALLWLHEQEVIRLDKGLAVFRPAMTIRLGADKRNFARSDFAPLQLHYDEVVLQIHVMAEYAQRGLQAMDDALRLAVDYFTLQREDFMQRWLPARDKELARQTTPASWRAIVESLANPVQQRIVADDREQTNVLVLAGPGSGKTRVLVHRIAYLVRARRVEARGIVALAYNRHAAVQIRQRLRALIGDDAHGVTVLTCHALAMRLAGVSFEGRGANDDAVFADALRQAVDLLEGKGLPPDEADDQRDRLLAGFRWILVDEYQDIGPDQYRLISALAGRTLKDDDGKLSLFAVGDDDQNIYGFSGASVEFIRRFEADYAARTVYLTDNYRSTAHIVAAANRLIAPARQRLKAGQPIEIDRARRRQPAGGDWEALDPVARGRVQLLDAGDSPQTQALAALDELQRLASLAAGWDRARCAVIARQWRTLDPVRAACELRDIPVQVAGDEPPQFWRLRETQALVAWLRESGSGLADTAAMQRWVAAQPANPWWSLLAEVIDAYGLETGGAELPIAHFVASLVEGGRELRRRQTGLLLLTAHRAKGLEFDHVAVLDGGWDRADAAEDRDAARRLYYVAMTRARETLTLLRIGRGARLLEALAGCEAVVERAVAVAGSDSASASAQLPRELGQRYLRLTPGDVDIGYAGRRRAGDPLHAAIAEVRVGETLELRGAELVSAAGQVVGRLARGYALPAGTRCVAARVAAVLVRRRSDTPPEHLDSVRCEAWEVVLPEVVVEAMQMSTGS